MSFISVYVHYVWATKNRIPFLTDEIRKDVFSHIRNNAESKNIFIDFINGYMDHVHCLVSLNDNLSIGKIAQLLKGESSFWINQRKLTATKFAWQDEYFAIGVGDDSLNTVRKYIANQEEHHKKLTFAQEYEKFIERYGFNIIKK
ncbi:MULTISPECIES: IS200/IS605 family transposase [unclassified Carboxylicivirga]|uniref:IS200/IS605 family transposase n=1 Tax=Carboxylicivirga TaxID=1628153 RepID=UPI003D34B0FC